MNMPCVGWMAIDGQFKLISRVLRDYRRIQRDAKTATESLVIEHEIRRIKLVYRRHREGWRRHLMN